ncbi:solute carrier family 35 member F5-like [Mytilus galloprovincialis]|uniref:solute carrier family 35 member F5-like n=1 Tax=Mytilus galloprovincialis TaxID=29158 RepID=UPI003F7B4515
MLGTTRLTKVQRLVLGIIVLLVVDLIWVGSSELTEYLFKEEDFNKPFFTTYAKTSMFMIYLFGFLFWEPWRRQCRNGGNLPNLISQLQDDNIEEERPSSPDSNHTLSDPVYVPVRRGEDKTSGTESDDCSLSSGKSVRFNKVSEVRHLSETYAEDANLARLSYSASLLAEEAKLRSMSKLSVKQVMKLAIFFCILWFFANFSYQQALLDTQAGVVNVLSSTSGLFTLICAAIFPSSGADRFSLSKLVTVLVSIGGIVMVSLADMNMEKGIPAGALWAVLGSMLYAFYLVSLRRNVDHEDKLDIPMFFGFVGFFCVIFIWPGFFITHYSKEETFQWPNGKQWLFICINGLIGTVVSEFLWLWGCFLTSSLIATLSLSLTIPLTMLADVIFKGIPYTWLFYVGTLPVFIAFFAVSLLTHYENWDPVLIGCKKILHCICRKRILPRYREVDREQTESLINDNNVQ